MAGRFSNPNVQYLDENGDPLAGGKLAFFESNTSTPLDTFSDDNLSVKNTNPIILDDAGRSGDIFFLNQDYKVQLSDADDAVIWTADPVRSTEQKSSEVRQVSTTTQLDSSDDGKWIAANANAGGFVITLPPASEAGNGYEVTIQKTDSSTNVATVDASGSETINGQSDVSLDRQYQAITVRCDGTSWLAALEEGRSLTPDHINGLEISNGASPNTDITVSAGSARSDDDTVNIVLQNAITKKLNAAFAEGNNQGCLDTGTVQATTVYDLYVISKDDETTDVLATKKNDNPSLPSGFTNKRFIGRIETDDSSNIVPNTYLQVKIDGQHSYHEVDTTSGSEKFMLCLPDGPDWWDLGLDGISFTATANLEIQGGDDSTVQTTGYTGAVQAGGGVVVWSTAGLYCRSLAAGANYYGSFRGAISSTASDVYHSHGLGATSSDVLEVAGFFNLDGKVLSVLRFAPSAGDFDAGKITLRTFRRNTS